MNKHKYASLSSFNSKLGEHFFNHNVENNDSKFDLVNLSSGSLISKNCFSL